jgi:hypothetical protein
MTIQDTWMKKLWLCWEDMYGMQNMHLAVESGRLQLDALGYSEYTGSQSMTLEVNRCPVIEGFKRAAGFDAAGEFLKYILCRAQK